MVTFIANDATEFVESLRQLIGDRAMRDRFRSNARDAVRDLFDWKAIAARFGSQIGINGNNSPTTLEALARPPGRSDSRCAMP